MSLLKSQAQKAREERQVEERQSGEQPIVVNQGPLSSLPAGSRSVVQNMEDLQQAVEQIQEESRTGSKTKVYVQLKMKFYQAVTDYIFEQRAGVNKQIIDVFTEFLGITKGRFTAEYIATVVNLNQQKFLQDVTSSKSVAFTNISKYIFGLGVLLETSQIGAPAYWDTDWFKTQAPGFDSLLVVRQVNKACELAIQNNFSNRPVQFDTQFGPQIKEIMQKGYSMMDFAVKIYIPKILFDKYRQDKMNQEPTRQYPNLDGDVDVERMMSTLDKVPQQNQMLKSNIFVPLKDSNLQLSTLKINNRAPQNKNLSAPIKELQGAVKKYYLQPAKYSANKQIVQGRLLNDNARPSFFNVAQAIHSAKYKQNKPINWGQYFQRALKTQNSFLSVHPYYNWNKDLGIYQWTAKDIKQPAIPKDVNQRTLPMQAFQKVIPQDQIGSLIQPIIKLINQKLVSIGYQPMGPVNLDGLPLFLGRYIDPSTKRIKLLKSGKGMTTNPIDWDQNYVKKVLQLATRWNRFVSGFNALSNFSKKGQRWHQVTYRMQKRNQPEVLKQRFIKKVYQTVKTLLAKVDQKKPLNLFERLIRTMINSNSFKDSLKTWNYQALKRNIQSKVKDIQANRISFPMTQRQQQALRKYQLIDLLISKRAAQFEVYSKLPLPISIKQNKAELKQRVDAQLEKTLSSKRFSEAKPLMLGEYLKRDKQKEKKLREGRLKDPDHVYHNILSDNPAATLRKNHLPAFTFLH